MMRSTIGDRNLGKTMISLLMMRDMAIETTVVRSGRFQREMLKMAVKRKKENLK
jgi:hypothetical protein